MSEEQELVSSSEAVLALEQFDAKTIQRLKSVVTLLSDDVSPEAAALSDKAILKVQLLEDRVKLVVDASSLEATSVLQHADGGGSCSIAVWQGDCSLLRVGAIVNAANKVMLGCFTVNHSCIDNVIHWRSGVRLRMECRKVMRGKLEATGCCRVTPGHCLPCQHVMHTVGPIAQYKGHEQPRLLASCYTSCMQSAHHSRIRSLAFCCISTGVFGYPQEAACRVAVTAVHDWLVANPNCGIERVVFNTYLPNDTQLYHDIVPEIFGH